MLTLGIDPSLTGFGWCVHNSEALGEGRIVASGVISTPSSEVFVSRYARLRAGLVYLIDKYPVAGVGVESPPFGELWSEGLYALFIYVNEALYLARKNVVYFDPSTVKMLAKMDPTVRRGSMDKLDMVEAAKAEVGKRLNHNVADAYIIGRSAARFWELETGVITREELTPAEERSFHRVHTFTKGKRQGVTVQGGLIFREDDRFFKFSERPVDPDEEEFRQWLCRKGSKVLAEMEGPNPPSRLKAQRIKK
jgi:Holliday junction resolvasome RuvABC endonuclease subunit